MPLADGWAAIDPPLLRDEDGCVTCATVARISREDCEGWTGQRTSAGDEALWWVLRRIGKARLRQVKSRVDIVLATLGHDGAERLIEALGDLVRDRRASPGPCDLCRTVLEADETYLVGRALLCVDCRWRWAEHWDLVGLVPFRILLAFVGEQIEQEPCQGVECDGS